MLAEATNLLRMPGRQMALPDELDAKTAPDAPELTPRQIEEKVSKDLENWGKKADALREAAVKAIDNACEQCHVVYWYPDEKKATPKS